MPARRPRTPTPSPARRCPADRRRRLPCRARPARRVRRSGVSRGAPGEVGPPTLSAGPPFPGELPGRVAAHAASLSALAVAVALAAALGAGGRDSGAVLDRVSALAGAAAGHLGDGATVLPTGREGLMG